MYQLRTGSLAAPRVHWLLPLLLSFPFLRFGPSSGTDQKLRAGGSVLAIPLLLPRAFFFRFTILVGALWGEHTATT